MKKIFNIIFYLACAFIITILGLLSYHYHEAPLRETPAPYVMAPGVFGPDEVASNADVLIVGDEMGVSIGPFINDITTQLSKKLARPLSIYNISTKGESLYRTIERVAALKKVPKILILASGYSELQEDIYPTKKDAIKVNNQNFKLFRNLYIQSLIKLHPNLSRLIFLNENLKQLTSEIEQIDFENLSPERFRSILEKELLLYDIRLEKFFRNLKSQGINILTIIPPINMEINDLKICQDTTSVLFEDALSKLETLLSESKTKEAHVLVQSLDKNILANTKFHQLKQEFFEKQGEITKAYDQALQKVAFACEVKSSHPLFIKQLEKIAAHQNVDIVDFNEVLKQNYTRNPLFISNKAPQSIYYPKLVSELVIKLKQITQLK
ncbi:hypothetical protein [Halobacteriovorax sp. RT-2-6]|uniref:hypothetical protein n=1 Tax=unclassified Halobacteriovorax TaxID=2639665 RepID=UPI003999F25D